MIQEKRHIALVGSGNVAWHLSRMFSKIDHYTFQLFCRKGNEELESFDHLEQNQIKPLEGLDQIPKNTLVFLCVKDDAIAVLGKSIQEKIDGVYLIHCSGARALNDVNQNGKGGVFYPFQSFSKGKELKEKHFHVFLEATDSTLEALLRDVAKEMGLNAHYLASDARAYLHLSGVLTNNFCNALLIASRELLAQESIDEKVLIPLINETVFKNFSTPNPKETQTGPARRGDQKSVEKHLNLLKHGPELQNLYRDFSHYISKTYNA